MDNKCNPKELKNKLAQAIFSKEGPNLTKPDVTKRPNVTPNTYNEINRNIVGSLF